MFATKQSNECLQQNNLMDVCNKTVAFFISKRINPNKSEIPYKEVSEMIAVIENMEKIFGSIKKHWNEAKHGGQEDEDYPWRWKSAPGALLTSEKPPSRLPQQRRQQHNNNTATTTTTTITTTARRSTSCTSITNIRVNQQNPSQVRMSGYPPTTHLIPHPQHSSQPPKWKESQESHFSSGEVLENLQVPSGLPFLRAEKENHLW